MCDWTNLVPGGADTVWYGFTDIINATNREADITITKAIANVSITMPDEVTEGKVLRSIRKKIAHLADEVGFLFVQSRKECQTMIKALI